MGKNTLPPSSPPHCNMSNLTISWCQKNHFTKRRAVVERSVVLKKKKKPGSITLYIVLPFRVNYTFLSLFFFYKKKNTTGKQFQERRVSSPPSPPKVFVLLYCTILPACLVHVENNTDRLRGERTKGTQRGKRRREDEPDGAQYSQLRRWGGGVG